MILLDLFMHAYFEGLDCIGCILDLFAPFQTPDATVKEQV